MKCFLWKKEKHFLEKCLHEIHFIQRVLFPSYMLDHHAKFAEFSRQIYEVPFSGSSLTAGQSILDPFCLS